MPRAGWASSNVSSYRSRSETTSQLSGGIPTSQDEIVRPQDLRLGPKERRTLASPAAERLEHGNSPVAKLRLVVHATSRLGCDTRIPNIFERAAEARAHVIARPC